MTDATRETELEAGDAIKQLVSAAWARSRSRVTAAEAVVRADLLAVQHAREEALARAVSVETRNTPKGTLAAIVRDLEQWSPNNENIKQGYIAAAVRDVLQVMVTSRDNANEAMVQLTEARAALAVAQQERETLADRLCEVAVLRLQRAEAAEAEVARLTRQESAVVALADRASRLTRRDEALTAALATLREKHEALQAEQIRVIGCIPTYAGRYGHEKNELHEAIAALLSIPQEGT